VKRNSFFGGGKGLKKNLDTILFNPLLATVDLRRDQGQWDTMISPHSSHFNREEVIRQPLLVFFWTIMFVSMKKCRATPAHHGP
jgi:hypothetical protein